MYVGAVLLGNFIWQWVSFTNKQVSSNRIAIMECLAAE